MPIASDLTIDDTALAIDLAQNIFGQGTMVNSASLTGADVQSGIYTGGDATLGAAGPSDSGVILSTGNVADFTNGTGTNDTNTNAGTSTNHGGAGYADLDVVSGQATQDAVVLDINFTPTGDYITMQFTFSSEEYLEYVNDGFNDAFGIWINETYIPFTPSPDGNVSINSINDASASNLYLDNAATDDTYNTEMDGTTVTLSIKAPVNSGEENNIVIALGDGGDGAYDSNVLIAANSAQTIALAFEDSVEMEPNTQIVLDVLNNDIDVTGSGLTITEINGVPIVTGQTVVLPTGESITLNADGTLTIENDGDIGSETFTYAVIDGVGNTDVGYVTLNTVTDAAPNYIVEGGGGDDLIDASYTGDAQGDMIDNNDALDASNNDSIIAGGGNDTVIAGLGDDTIDAGTGNDSVIGGQGSDQIILDDDFGVDNIDGSEDAGDTDTDVLDASTMTTNITVNLFGADPESGTLTSGSNTATFDNIENITLGSGDDSVTGSTGDDTITAGTGADTVKMGAGNDIVDLGAGAPDGDQDVVILQDGFGNDIVTNFDGPTGTGPFVGVDTLDVTNLTDANGDPVNTNDITVSSSGGQTLLTFPNGETLLLTGISPTDAQNPFYLNATGIPLPDGTIEGTAGDDLINGAYTGDPDGDMVDGNDAVIVGDTGNDDLIYGYDGNDSIAAGNGNDEVYGGAGNDNISATRNNEIFGGDANDTVYVSSGISTLDGGAGDDILQFGFSGRGTIYGGDGNDQLLGYNGNDMLFGGADDDILRNGGGGNDTLFGGTGADTFQTGQLSGTPGVDLGNATIFSAEDDAEIDVVTFSTHNQGVTITSTGDEAATFSEGGDTGTYQGIEGVVGTRFNDVIDGALDGSGLNIDAGRGNDSIIGGAGDDTVTAGRGADTVNTGAGNDVVNLGAGAPDGNADMVILQDGFGDDIVTNFDGPTGTGPFVGVDTLDVTNLLDANGDPVNTNDVTVTDVGGNAVLTFPNGESITLVGISPTDADDPFYLNAIGIPLPDGTISGTSGDDVIDDSYTGDPDGDMVDAGDAIISGHGINDDFIESGAGKDTIISGLGNDTVYAGTGNDTIFGGAGSDNLYGGDGDDTIVFSDGDSVSGGSGDDTFQAADLFETTNGTITIVGGATEESSNDGDPNTIEGDTLKLGTLADLSTLVQTSDGINASGNETFSGSVTMDDGAILNFSEIENIICFTPGTRIATPMGARDITTLRVGDMVVTRDHGLQPIRWIRSRTVPALDRFAPIRIKPGVITGQERDLLVSPQHRMMFQDYRAELLFGESEVLVAAKHLVDGMQVTQDVGGEVTYIHMMFDEHEVVYAEGAATESFHPGDVGLTAISDPAREELFALFPDLRTNANSYGQTARRCLKRHECNLLVR